MIPKIKSVQRRQVPILLLHLCQETNPKQRIWKNLEKVRKVPGDLIGV
jgi:hypothetical protein